MANLKDVLKMHREKFEAEIEDNDALSEGEKGEALAAFDRSLASVLIDQLEPEEPKKRAYTRKPKPQTTSE